MHASAASSGAAARSRARRLCCEAPLLLIDEGTAESQKTIIGRRLLDQFKIALPGPAVITGA